MSFAGSRLVDEISSPCRKCFIDCLAQKRYHFISMKWLGALLLTFAITLLATTFAGMAMFGMNTQMVGMDMDHCMSGSHCQQSNASDAGGMDCVNHCISATTTATTTSAAVVISFVLFLVSVFLLQDGKKRHSKPLYALQRWREGIGKVLLHQQLAGVMLRD